MCLLLSAYRQHPRYPLLLLANRDEYYRRPTAPAQWWEFGGIVAGRDLEAGGTWLGVAPRGGGWPRRRHTALGAELYRWPGQWRIASFPPAPPSYAHHRKPLM